MNEKQAALIEGVMWGMFLGIQLTMMMFYAFS